MREVAIIGAGELGGALAHVLARRNAARFIRLIDEKGRVAEGKALDILEAAPVEGFATGLAGSNDIASAAGASVIVLADGAGGSEWQGENGLMLLRRLGHASSSAIIVCAGAAQRELVERGVRELHIPRARILGSAPEALAAGARALVALEHDASPRDISLSILGVPPGRTVVSWEGATIAGMALTRLSNEPSRHRLTDRITALWPPGPYALATGAVKVVETILGRSRRLACCFVAPDDAGGLRSRAAAMPVRLGAGGVVEVVLPPLSPAERVALDNAITL